MTQDDSNFDLSSGRDTLEENGVQVYHGKPLSQNPACTSAAVMLSCACSGITSCECKHYQMSVSAATVS